MNQQLLLTTSSNSNEVFLTRCHALYENDDKWKIGLEAYYYSRQQLTDGTFGKPYWITGFMVEKAWKKFSLFVNFENFTDTRQSKFSAIYSGSIDHPVFKDIYAPVEGFVVNGGVKIFGL